MFDCPNCNKPIELIIGLNICSKCNNIVTVVSKGPADPANIPDDIDTLTDLDFAKLLSDFIHAPDEIWIIADQLHIRGNIHFDRSNFSYSLFSLVQTIRKFYAHNKWKERGKPIVLEWLDYKQTTR